MRTHKRFVSLLQRLGAKGDLESSWKELVNCYAESHRAYHTLKHIAHSLEKFDLAKNLIRYPAAVEMAIFYHDAVYAPGAKNNEKKSAKLAERFLKNLGVEKTFRTTVADLINSTTFLSSLETHDEKFLHDIDYSILGEEKAVFAEYESGVRKEFGQLSVVEYQKGRRMFLETLLVKPSIFLTEFFQKKYESTARSNIKKALKRLG